MNKARPSTPQHDPPQPQRNTVLVAKERPIDFTQDEPTYFLRDTIPLSLVNNTKMGPRKADDGNWLSHSLLGDVEDYEEMERELGLDISNTVREEVAEEPLKVTKEVTFKEQFNEAGSELTQIEKLKKLAERKRWLDQLHIFQRFREVREEHALKNWQRHSVEWARMEKTVSKRANRDTERLLMARLGEYRQFVEERELIEEALMMLEHKSVNFWKTGMRIGNDLLGLTLPMPTGGPREIERLRRIEEKDGAHVPGDTDYRHAKREQLKHIISALDPFYGNSQGGYLEVQGHDVRGVQIQLIKEYLARLDKKFKNNNEEAEDSLQTQESMEANPDSSKTGIEKEETETAASDVGPSILLPINRLSFEVELNQVAVSMLSIHNRGSTPIHFEWEPTDKTNLFSVGLSNDSIQRFYFHQKKGVIMPGTAFDFRIIFKSASPGIFTELWKLKTYPPLPNASELIATLQGTAVEVDSNAAKRKQIEKNLCHKEGLQVAKDIIDVVIRNMNLGTTENALTKKKNPDLTLFEWSNRELDLHYTPLVFARFEELAIETLTLIGKPNHYWNRSVMSLYEHINQVPNDDKRAASLCLLNELITQAAQPLPTTGGNSLLHMISYDILVDLTSKIVDSSDSMRRRYRLPLQRSAMIFSEGVEEAFEMTEESLRRGTMLPTQIPASIKGAAPTNAGKDAKKGAPAPAAPAKTDPKKAATAAPAAAKKADNDVLGPLPDDKPKVRPPKVRSANSWSPERRLAEAQYKAEFTAQVRELLDAAINRMCDLWGETMSEHENVHGPMS